MDFQSSIAKRSAHKILSLVFAVIFSGAAALAAGTPVFACGLGAGCPQCNVPGRVALNSPACCAAPSRFSAAACSMSCCGDDAGMSARFQFVVSDSRLDGTAFSNLAAGTSAGCAGMAPMPARESRDFRLSATSATAVYLQNLSLRL